MSQDSNQQRYDEILKKIANRQSSNAKFHDRPHRSAYDLVLDALNVYDMMADLQTAQYTPILCYGPQVIRKATWSGVVIWYRHKGYYGYQTLYLLGTWARQIDTEIQVVIGIRELVYCAAIYNPEGYHASIQTGFHLFYEDDGHPPDDTDTIMFQSIYQQKERLTLRQTLPKIFNQWQIDNNA